MFEKLARAKILIAKHISGHAEKRYGPSCLLTIIIFFKIGIENKTVT